MKQLICAGLLLVALLGITLGHSRYIQASVDDFVSRLTAARELADRGAWDAADRLTRQVWRDWQRRDAVFHALLRHSEIDQIHVTMYEVLEALSLSDPALYNPANTRLIAQLSLLAQMERLTLQNVL